MAAGSDQFEEIRQLAGRYQASVKSFQLKPFSWEEIEAFTLFYLFPAESSSRLSIPAEIQKQLRNSSGLVGRLIEILSREEVGTAIKLDGKPSNYKKPLVLAGALLAILLVVALLYPLADRQERLPSQISSSVDPESPALKEEQIAVKIEESDQDDSVTDEPVTETEVSMLESPPDEAVSEPTVEPDTEAKQESLIDNQEEVAPNQIRSKILDEASDQDEPIEENAQRMTRLQQDLSNSLDWIKNIDKNRGTIQIMTIGFDNFTENAYYTHLDKFVQQGIDISRINIFQTNASGLVVYSVVYDEYENRGEAKKSIQLLPNTLKANKPIPRTIGGIWNEIN